jgi:AAA ATPase domain
MNARRKRGIILTNIGRDKLMTARARWEQQQNNGIRYKIEQLSEITELAPNTLNKILIHNTYVDKSTLARCFKSFGAILTPDDYEYRSSKQTERQQTDLQPVGNRNSYLSWGEAPDVSTFYGRERELQTLTDWVQRDRCRLIAIVGMGGMGKTTLVTKLAHQLQSQFTTICWRSLRNAPVLSSLLPDLIRVCSQDRELVAISSTSADRISQLLSHLDRHRCLLIFDNIEAILQAGKADNLAGRYRQHYEDYGEFFERIGTSIHQSCLLLTSREKPANIAYLASADRPIRMSSLMGLDLANSNYLFDAKSLSGSPLGRSKLVEIYTGNPLALKIVATTIEELFDLDIDCFLAAETFIFDEIRQLFDQQFERLSEREQMVMYWLAIERELVGWQDLQAEIVPPIAKVELLDTLKSLRRRCLIEQSQGKFTQQAAILEYVTERTLAHICMELWGWNESKNLARCPLWWSHLLLKAQLPEHRRTVQRLQILQPIVEWLILEFGSIDNLVERLQRIISSL